MKPVFTILLCLCCNFASAQYYQRGISEFINFDSTASAMWYNPGDPNHFIPLLYMRDTCHVVIDSSYHHNKWQIGQPAKQHFTSAYSAPNAIVTDLTQVCVPGDTSVFIINVPNDTWVVLPILSFIYRFDADTGDIAMVEVSADTAKTWTTIYADTFDHITNYPFIYPAANPIWDSFALRKVPVAHSSYFNSFYRFTFISGSSAKHRDGWIIDNIWFGYVAEALPEINRNISATISPNPSNQYATIKYSLTQRADLAVKLFDGLGRQVKQLTIPNAVSGQAQLTTNDLPMGMYYYVLATEYGQATGKLLITH